ncbi:chemotaxis protein [Solidesulfovibrio sp.]|uniref:chemotaxis protein n=1 Tax=Solidesulfovibrio sp. TaxID=2910990 RepID=UPI002B2013AF|nr:chemotaxis protein CheW [Solidesulfovibrio sp.]MEA5088259.1 chemotaxis protein CheW [Solidesulfovibrio sp.]
MSSEQHLALTEVGTNEVEIMCFYIDIHAGASVYRAYYGINVAKVLKITRLPEQVMRPPLTTHDSVYGAFHFKDRDKVVPVVALARYLEQPQVESDAQKLIITEFNQVMTAFLVSGITRIYRLSWADVEKPDKYINAYSHNAFTGLVNLEGHIVFILDLEKVVIELNPDSGKNFFGVANAVKADRNIHVLHVDDQAIVRRMVKRALEQDESFTVESADSGQEALLMLRDKLAEAREKGCAVTDLVNVVVSDVEMPVMDGYTLCRSIKDDPELARLPVYLFSSLITEETLHKGRSVRADGQFPKPQTEVMAREILADLARKCIENPAAGTA